MNKITFLLVMSQLLFQLVFGSKSTLTYPLQFAAFIHTGKDKVVSSLRFALMLVYCRSN